MEYTDAPAQPQVISMDTMPCPYCGHTLPANAQACDQCDWTRSATETQQTETETAEGKGSDAMAVILSLIPGLGHMYKGHKLAGFFWMFGAIPAGALVLIAAFASAGFGIGLFFIYLIACMIHVWGIEDWVKPKKDEGEQY